MAAPSDLRCSSCKAKKPSEAFYRSHSASRGRQSWCKDCQKRRLRKREVIRLDCNSCHQPYERVAKPVFKALLYRPVCARCSRLERAKANGGHAPGYKGTAHFSGRQICKWKLSAKRRGHEWALKNSDLDDVYDRQQGLCALSGLPMVWTGSEAYRPSLDRIDSALGYYRENIQFLCSIVNLMKNRIKEQAFVKLCELISDHTNKVRP